MNKIQWLKEEAKAMAAKIEGFFDQMDNEAVASSKGLTSRWESLVSGRQ